MSAKSKRGGCEPSWTEVIVGALLSVIVGATLGVVFLVFKPVITVNEMPNEDERDRSSVYFIEGHRDAAKAKLAGAKRKIFVRGGSVLVNENELNSLVEAPGAKASPAAKTPAAAPSDLFGCEPGALNFRIYDSALQLGVPVKVNLYGLELTVVVQGRGTFVKTGENFAYAPATVLVGSCPVDPLPMARAFVMKKIFEMQPVPEDISKVWGNLSDVAVVGTALKLTMP
jgi:hypothetical protein